MVMLYLNRKKYSDSKGFTLVELLAVIVVLAIIMLIAIPAILDSLDNAKRKSFETYANRILSLADQETLKREMDGNSFGEQCYVYNITKDFELNNTGDYKGYVLLQVSADTKKYYVTMWSNDYMLISYNITESKDYYGKKKSIQEALERYDSSREEELTIQSLCNYACNSCSYDSDGSKETIIGDPTQIKGATTLLKGSDLRNKFITLAGDSIIVNIKRSYELPEDKTKELLSLTSDESSKNNPVYAWFDTDTIYFYSEATQIFLNKDFSWLFYDFNSLKDVSDFINSTKTNKVENISNLFYKCSSLESLDLTNWTFENVLYMFEIFRDCKKLKKLDLNNWNVSNVKDIHRAFAYCKSLEELEIFNWDTSNVITAYELFLGCTNLKNLDLNKWNISKMTNISGMFNGCTKLETLNINNWNTSNIKSLSNMFYGTNSLKELDLSNWNVENVTNMVYTFKECHANIVLKNWNTKSLTNLNGTFQGTWCDLDLSSFDTSNVTTMDGTFHFSGGRIIDISSWDTSKVTNMERMFAYASVYHVYVGPKWTVAALPAVSEFMFHEAGNIHNRVHDSTSNRAYVGDGGYFEYKS